MYKNLIFNLTDQVACVSLNRPDSLNSLNLELLQELAESLTFCRDNSNIKVIILKGEGKVFCAGGDIKSMAKESDSSRVFLLRQLTLYLHAAISAIWRMQKPVIAAIHGAATGAGLALALSSDIVIAAEKTRIGTAYLALGLTPDGGTTYFLPRLIGIHKSKYLTFTSEVIDADIAEKIGIINKVVKEDMLLIEVMNLANKLAKGPALAIARTKDLLNQSFTQSLESQLESERDAICFASKTDDFNEGLNAFFTKKEPHFTGH